MDNRWNHGSRHLHVPPLPEHLQGSAGCLLAEAIFDPDMGNEVYLAVLEEPSWCLPLAATRPFQVFCKSGLAETKNGGIIFLIWRIAAESKNEVVREQFLNPDNIRAIRDLSKLAQQTHLKVLIINARSSEVIDWFEFENDFGFNGLLAGVIEMIGRLPEGDFSEAIEEFKARYTLEDLLKV